MERVFDVERLVGVDAVRGLAVLGMFAAHVGYAEDRLWTPTGWLAVADGRSSATFAVLAGVSLGLLSRRSRSAGEDAERELRRRVVARAAVVALIGYVLVALGTPIAVILPAYALMFVLMVAFLRARTSILVLVAGGFALVGPAAVRAAGGKALGAPTDLEGLLLTGFYPAVVWLAYVLVGLAVGRRPLRAHRTRLLLVLLGPALALAGYGVAAVVARRVPELATWLSIEPHANTTAEVVGNLGVALTVLGLMLAAAETRLGRILLTPLAATGAMALTVYTAQIVAIAFAGRAVVYDQTTNGTLLAYTVVTLVVCTLWVRTVGRGPLERLMRAVADTVAVRHPENEAARP